MLTKHDVKIAIKAITTVTALALGAFLLAAGMVTPEHGVGMAITGVCTMGLGLLVGRV